MPPRLIVIKIATRRPRKPGAKLAASLVPSHLAVSVLGTNRALEWEEGVGAQSPVPGISAPKRVFTYHPQPASLLHSKHRLSLHAGQVPLEDVIKVVRGWVDESVERSHVSSKPALEAEYQVHFGLAMQPAHEKISHSAGHVVTMDFPPGVAEELCWH